jgi:Uncharacterized conserved protein (DUF2190)
MADTPKVTRLEIAKLTKGDERMTRFLEALFRAVNDQTPTDIEAIRSGLSDVTAESAIAYAQAINCKAELGRIADALELIAAKPNTPPNLPITTDYIDLDPYGPHESRAYRVQWNTDDGTMDVGLTGDVVMQVGQEMMFYAKNGSGATVANGTPVMFTGAVGASGKLEFGPAVADGSVPRDHMMGVATQDIANGEFGYITSFGLVRRFDTTGTPYGETWAEGDLLYFSDSTPGEWTNVAPTSPSITVPVAVVVRAHAVTGIIFVRMHIQQSTAINDTGRLIDSIVTLNNGAGANIGTLTNAPTAGNPTKWVAVDDNGTTRYIPAW